MAYSFRFKAEIGDIAYSVTDDSKGNVHVDKVTISEIQDNSYTVKTNKDGENELVRNEDYADFSIGYWVKEISLGRELYFGDDLYLSEQEALIEASLVEAERKEDELGKRES